MILFVSMTIAGGQEGSRRFTDVRPLITGLPTDRYDPQGDPWAGTSTYDKNSKNSLETVDLPFSTVPPASISETSTVMANWM